MSFLTLKSVWNNFQLLLLMTTMLTIGIFLGIVYQAVLEQYLLVFAIVGFSIGIWMLVMWLRKMFSEPHMEQVP
jgi:uncharacterized membrane protein YfcA